MDPILWVSLIGFAVLLGLSAFFSSSETSFFSLDQIQIEQMRRDRNPSVGLIQKMLGQPRRLIVTILLGNELVNVAASVLSASIVISLLGPEKSWVNLVVMVPVLLLVGEIVPKSVALRHNVRFATFQARYVDLFSRMVTPLRWVVRHVADRIISLVVGKERTRGSILTEDMVRVLAREAVGEGALDQQEAQYINRIFDFGEITLRERMVCRSQILMVSAGAPLQEITAEIQRTGHTKVPVHDEGTDEILGFLFARDLLGIDVEALEPAEHREVLLGLLRKPFFVPETQMVEELFRAFRSRRLSIALVVDEYGGVTGLVTMEDLLECIFGNITSRADRLRENRSAPSDLGNGRFRIEPTMRVRRFNSSFDSRLPVEKAETIGGLVLHAYGELPEAGATVSLGGFRFTVEEVLGQRITALVVEIEPPEPAAGEDRGE